MDASFTFSPEEGNGFGFRKLLCSFWNIVHWVESTNQARLNASVIWLLKFPSNHRVPQSVCSLLHVKINFSFTSAGSIIRRRRNIPPMEETKKRNPLERYIMRRKSSVLRGQWDRQTAGFSVQVIACVVRCVSYSEQKETSASDG